MEWVVLTMVVREATMTKKKREEKGIKIRWRMMERSGSDWDFWDT